MTWAEWFLALVLAASGIGLLVLRGIDSYDRTVAQAEADEWGEQR